MSLSISCPHCQVKLRLPPEAFGQNVKCPRCQSLFLATDKPAAAGTPFAEATFPDLGATPASPRGGRTADSPAAGRGGTDEEELPNEFENLAAPDAPLTEEAQALLSVRTGVGFYLLSHIIYLGGMALVLLFAIVAMFVSRDPGRALIIMLTLFLFLGMMAILSGLVIAIIGTCYWLPAPVGNGARGLGVGCLAIGSLVLLQMPNLVQALPTGGRGRGHEEAFGLGMLFIVGFEAARLVLFPFFLRAMARNLRLRGLGMQTAALGVGTGGTFGVLFLLFLLVTVILMSGSEASSPGMPTMMKITILIFLLAIIGVIVWGMITLQAFRNRMGTRPR
jgi:hypothetical protein